MFTAAQVGALMTELTDLQAAHRLNDIEQAKLGAAWQVLNELAIALRNKEKLRVQPALCCPECGCDDVAPDFRDGMYDCECGACGHAFWAASQ